MKIRLKNDHGEEETFTEIGFREITEPWASYILDNGTTLRIKQVLLSVFEADRARDDDGNPIYHLEGSTTVVASHSEEQET